jgi:O-antigen ligase
MLLVLERLLVNRRRVRMVIGAAIASAIVPGLVAASQLAGGGGLFTAGGFSRIRGTFVHPNPFAIYLTFLIIMGAAVLPHLGERVRVPALLVLGGCSLCLFLTYTRTGWIATVVGLVVVGALQNKRMLALMVMGGIVGLLLVPSIIGRFSDLGQTQRASGTAGNSLIWRLDYWTQILPLADKNPVTGIGLKMTQFNTEEQKAPHNDYIRSYVETGILGFLAYLGIQVAMVRTARRALRKTKGRQSIDRGVAVGFAGCATAFALISVVSNVISSSVLLWYLFAFAASAIAVSRFPAEEAVPAGVPA